MSDELTTEPMTVSDRCMAGLRKLYLGMGLLWALAVGKHIVDTLYRGDIGRYYDLDGHKDDPFEEMVTIHGAELSAMGLGKQTLRNYLIAWDVHRHLPPDTQNLLTASHLVELQPLANNADRIELARLASFHAWTVKELDAAVAARIQELTGDQPRRGRPRQSDEVKHVKAADRSLTRLEELKAKRGSLADLPLGERHALRKLLVGVHMRSEALLRDLEG